MLFRDTIVAAPLKPGCRVANPSAVVKPFPRHIVAAPLKRRHAERSE